MTLGLHFSSPFVFKQKHLTLVSLLAHNQATLTKALLHSTKSDPMYEHLDCEVQYIQAMSENHETTMVSIAPPKDR